jgi:hypothetical protein
MTERIHLTPQSDIELGLQLRKYFRVNDMPEGSVVNLIFRSEGDAYRTPVVIDDFDRVVGQTGLTVCFLSEDLRLASGKVPGTVMQDVWSPEEPYPFINSETMTGAQIICGFFRPYENASPRAVLNDVARLSMVEETNYVRPDSIHIERLIKGPKRQ